MILTSFSNFAPVIPYNHTLMKVVSGLPDRAASGPCVLTIGNFDGLHLGHKEILRTVVEQARALRLAPAVLTFDPHPVRVLAPELADSRLTRRMFQEAESVMVEQPACCRGTQANFGVVQKYPVDFTKLLAGL